ncbi:glycosyl transferase [Halomonas daqingensis]|uniref:Glycosyl transferase n=1 Tax=Billgrantia desiderata TaxID=52021 RepID=A0ABS9B2X3_9GAMM|nr:ATP-grasp fold amidoligase family protein [Halomonas desiderata]MCE8041742.1 glycosyl transferase [Halomonas desiderata]MCE8046317.1 glycosyl transferase [Halomonas desiderata]
MSKNKECLLKNLRRACRLMWRKVLSKLYKTSPEAAARLLYFQKTGKVIDIKNPRSFNEKLQWLNIYSKDPLRSICADKYRVREYAERQGCAGILKTLIAVYDSVGDIAWSDLPKKFALKCTHGCGYNIVSADKDELDQEEVKEKLRKWMGERFGSKNLEFHYDKIIPRIILEEYVEGEDGDLPRDYNVYCFNGVARLVEVWTEKGGEEWQDVFDLDWQRLNIGRKKSFERPVERPKCLDEMIRYAQLLANPFPFVRVDFYEKNGEPILAEMTFTPGANMSEGYYTRYGLEYLGSLLELPNKDATAELGGQPRPRMWY